MRYPHVAHYVHMHPVHGLDVLRGHDLLAAVGVDLRVAEEEEAVAVADGEVQVVEDDADADVPLLGDEALRTVRRVLADPRWTLSVQLTVF